MQSTTQDAAQPGPVILYYIHAYAEEAERERIEYAARYSALLFMQRAGSRVKTTTADDAVQVPRSGVPPVGFDADHAIHTSESTSRMLKNACYHLITSLPNSAHTLPLHHFAYASRLVPLSHLTRRLDVDCPL